MRETNLPKRVEYVGVFGTVLKTLHRNVLANKSLCVTVKGSEVAVDFMRE